jgi:hypothetical protein
MNLKAHNEEQHDEEAANQDVSDHDVQLLKTILDIITVFWLLYYVTVSHFESL